MSFGDGFEEVTATIYQPKATGPGFQDAAVGTLSVHLQPASRSEYLSRQDIGQFHGVIKYAFYDGIPSFTIKAGYRATIGSVNYTITRIDEWDTGGIDHWLMVLEGVK